MSRRASGARDTVERFPQISCVRVDVLSFRVECQGRVPKMVVFDLFIL